MTPYDKYAQEIQAGRRVEDPHQRRAIEALQGVYDRLEGRGSRRRWFMRKNPASTQGVYLWGGVGRGKTWLMDQFYDCVKTPRKTRIHFHRFMRSIHEQLKRNRETPDPLARIGKDLARTYRLVCIDEFLVKDIADAVILAGVLRALFGRGAIVVTTSNTEPDELYRGGLQRERFVPAIDLIKRHTATVFIGDGDDYRLRSLAGRRLYYHPLSEASASAMQDEFEQLARDDSETGNTITVLGRDISAVRTTRNLAWFEFSDICDGPRANADYIEIANCYRTVMISGIPALTWELENQARRFIELVDEFYDRGVHLIVSAALAPEHLYSGTRLTQDFKRTASRLAEMQTEYYLAKAHCA